LDIQLAERPDRVFTWINRLGDLAHVFHDLRIPLQVVYELGVGRAEESLDDRSKARLSLGAAGLAAFVAGQQRLKVDTLELRSPIEDNQFWETVVPMDALAHDHHAGSVARLVEGQIYCQLTPGKGIGEKGCPGPAKMMPRARVNEFHVKGCVIDMYDLKWTVAVPRQGKG